MLSFEEYLRWDGTKIASLIRSKEIDPREVLTVAMSAVEKMNDQLGFVTQDMQEYGRKALGRLNPEAPFYGVPFLIKDLGIDVAGFPTTMSSAFSKDYMPKVSSTLFERYEAQGLVTLGKTNTPEFGVLGVTESKFRGACRTPWNLSLSAGGSSGGSAAAVAARCVPLAHGNDGGGSIRIPASACGIFGLKPSKNLVPSGPREFNSWFGLVANHVLTRSVRDSAALLFGTMGAERLSPDEGWDLSGHWDGKSAPLSRKLVIGVGEKPLFADRRDEDAQRSVEHAVKICRDLGHDVRPWVPDFDTDALLDAYLTMIAFSVATKIDLLAAEMKKRVEEHLFDETTWFLYRVGKRLRGYSLSLANERLQQAYRQQVESMHGVDVLLHCTTAQRTPPIGLMNMSFLEKWGGKILTAMAPEALLNRVYRGLARDGINASGNTMWLNMTGAPSMSVPLYWNPQSVPLGSQFSALRGQEPLLLSLAAQLEEAAPWHDRVPPIVFASN